MERERYYEVYRTWEMVNHENNGIKVGNVEKTAYRIMENADNKFKKLREEELEKIKAIREFGSLCSAVVTVDNDRLFKWFHYTSPGNTVTTHTVEILMFEFAD